MLLAWKASAPGPKTVVNQPQAAVRIARKYRRFVRAGLPVDEDTPFVGERDRHEVDRQSLGVSADLGPGDAVLRAAIIAGTGLDRRDLGVQRCFAKRRDDEADVVGEHRGEFASDEGAVGQAHGAAVRNDR